uniref:Uncharacterized protein n=1 Tax=Cacopsylla melanoneura TaxID=428564 RepID=A0A8D8XHW6_9HEMI
MHSNPMCIVFLTDGCCLLHYSLGSLQIKVLLLVLYQLMVLHCSMFGRIDLHCLARVTILHSFRLLEYLMKNLPKKRFIKKLILLEIRLRISHGTEPTYEYY